MCWLKRTLSWYSRCSRSRSLQSNPYHTGRLCLYRSPYSDCRYTHSHFLEFDSDTYTLSPQYTRLNDSMACSRSQWLILVSAAFVLFPPQPVFVHGWGCWYPDGSTPAPDTPCNQTAVDNGQTSACCGADAMCMDNGLCFGKGIVSRGSCTDKNWGEPCTQYCQDIGKTAHLFKTSINN